MSPPADGGEGPAALAPADASLDFEIFAARLAPLLGTEALCERVREAFSLDLRFRSEFMRLRPLILLKRKDWADELALHMMRFAAVSSDFTSEDMDRLRALFEAHLAEAVKGQFDAAYFHAVERLGAFFLHQGAPPLWLLGGFNAMQNTMLDLIAERREMREMAARRSAIRALSTWFAVDASQMQRVYIVYAEKNCVDAMISGGALARAPILITEARDGLAEGAAL